MEKLIRRLWPKVIPLKAYTFNFAWCTVVLWVFLKGKEKAEFWEVLGGKGPYITDMRTAEEIHEHEPRLFQCSNATGNMKVTMENIYFV